MTYQRSSFQDYTEQVRLLCEVDRLPNAQAPRVRLFLRRSLHEFPARLGPPLRYAAVAREEHGVCA